MGVRQDPLHHGRYWDATLNVVGGCEIVDPSCLHCYAVSYAAGIHTANDVELYRGTTEFKHGRHFWTGHLTVQTDGHPSWTEFVSWRFPKPLLGAGRPAIIWVNSMEDLFHPRRPIEPINRILETVAISPHLGLVVTKHPAQMVANFSQKPAWWRKKFILLFSAGDQRWWDRRWAIMRQLAERWIVGTSIQPMLAPVVLPPDFLTLGRWTKPRISA
jgi:protein gp37